MLRIFNDFSQISTEYQEHNGAVNTSTSPSVGYQYADGSANTIRATGMTYPNGRVLNLDYGTSGGTDDALSRIVSLIDDDGVTHLVDYTRIGVDGIVEATYPQPNIRYDLINGSGADPYSGLDQFDRVVDCRWWNITTTTDLERVKHTYDRADNRVTRENTVAKAQSPAVNQDEFYTYNEMYELDRLDRGQLNAGKTAIQPGTLNFAQAWGLDATGNWANFDQDGTGAGAFDLVQTRTHSLFNEIRAITGGGWVQPNYDLAGNMTIMPQPGAPGSSFAAVYDAWNRMVSVWSGGSQVGLYRFDALNRRVSKLVSGALRDVFYTAAWQAIEERVGGATTPDRQFVWGLRYIDDLVLRDRSAERLFGIQDPNCNLTAICNATGAAQERYRYAAYGLATILTATFASRGTSSFDWETRFGGYRFDDESELILVRERFLSASLGRWLARDRVGDVDGPNLLSFVVNNPIGRVDPSGMAYTFADCTQEEEDFLTHALDWINEVLKQKGKDCFKPYDRARPPGKQECRDQLAECIRKTKEQITFRCGGPKCQNGKPGSPAGYVIGTDACLKEKNKCRKGEECDPQAGDATCNACPADLLADSEVVLCHHGHLPSKRDRDGYATCWANDRCRETLLRGLVHEILHLCVGGHVDPRAGLPDACGRPDAGPLGSEFIYWCARRGNVPFTPFK